jgi:trans-aconitate 2-methyltransferase
VLGRLELRGDERVLDAGCGSGRVTELLAEQLPFGHVVALDASTAMLERAAQRLERLGERVEFVHADLVEPLPVEPVDAVLSTATFHWVPDHDALFANLAAALKSAGQIEAQCGGAGNLARLQRAVAETGTPWERATVFATPKETARRMERAGFVEVSCRLRAEPVELEAGEPYETYLRTVCLRDLLEQIPEPDRGAAVREIAERMPGPRLDYVRLEISARRNRSR